MNTNESFVASLREQIDLKHREALQALDVLTAYLLEGGASPAEKTTETKRVAPQSRSGNRLPGLTRVDKVLGTISGGYKLIGQIAKELEFSETEVRAVLYAKAVISRVHKKTIDGKLAFRLKGTSHAQDDDEKKSAASLVRELLARNQDGLRTSEINATLSDEVEKMGVNSAAIGAALYNMTKRGELIRDEMNGIYRLQSKSKAAN